MLALHKQRHSPRSHSRPAEEEKLPSTATTPSPKARSPLNPQEAKKEKSELCRRFMEYGFCPYEKRCKFAHGSHELLRNHEMNMKYKTKECDNYRLNLCCMYGNRCNFIHREHPQGESARNRSDILLRLAEREAQRSSRLLSLLGATNN